MIVQYSPEALRGIDALGAAHPAVGAIVNDELDRFEAAPQLARWRRRAYTGIAARTFGFDVRGRDDDILVIWQQTDETTVTVMYVGAPI